MKYCSHLTTHTPDTHPGGNCIPLQLGHMTSAQAKRRRGLECRKMGYKYYIEWNFVHPALPSNGRKKKRFKDHEVMAVHRKENVRLGHTSLRAAAKAVRLRNASLRDRISFTKIYEVIWPYKVSLLTSLRQCVTLSSRYKNGRAVNL